MRRQEQIGQSPGRTGLVPVFHARLSLKLACPQPFRASGKPQPAPRPREQDGNASPPSSRPICPRPHQPPGLTFHHSPTAGRWPQCPRNTTGPPSCAHPHGQTPVSASPSHSSERSLDMSPPDWVRGSGLGLCAATSLALFHAAGCRRRSGPPTLALRPLLPKCKGWARPVRRLDPAARPGQAFRSPDQGACGDQAAVGRHTRPPTPCSSLLAGLASQRHRFRAWSRQASSA